MTTAPFRLLALAAIAGAATTDARASVIPERVAQSVGLTRSWHTQAALDPATQTIVDARLMDDLLLVLTSAGKLQAIDAATGATVWGERFGEPSTTVLGPGVGDGRAAVIVGSTLYVCDLRTGRLALQRKIDGAPGGSPTLDDVRVYVPLLRGKLAAYPIDSAISPPFRVASPGRLFSRPLVTEGHVLWSTSRGDLHAASAVDGHSLYRLRLSSEVVGTPTAIGPNVYFATIDGDLHAIDGLRGTTRWRRPLGASVNLPAVGVADTVYVGDMTGRLRAYDAENGSLRWAYDGADLFVSATDRRVYAVGPTGNLAVLDRETGRLIASWPPAGKLIAITNTIDDRLYFVSESGRIQAFREVDRVKPYRHDGAEDGDVAEEPAAGEEAPVGLPPVAEDPFAAEPAVETPAEEEEDPFAEDPFGDDDAADTEDEEDPFAF